jgi:membrane fusion protein
MTLFFRKESIEHQQTKWVGKALLTPSTPAWLVLGLSLFFLTIFIAALTLGNYTRRINVFGEITSEPRSVNIFATQQGFISDRFVKVGDVVKKGDRLYLIDFSKVTHGGNFSIKTREAIESQLAQIEKIIDKLQKISS